MKKLIRLTENDLHRIIRESVSRILTEMDGASSAGDSGAFVGGNLALGGNSTSSIYDTSSSTGRHEGGKAQSKEVTDVPLGGIIRKAHNLGKKTKKKDSGVDMTPALDRSGGRNHSISINHIGES